MTGLSVLYAQEVAGEREWAAIAARDRIGRLREVYWARRAESKSGRKSFMDFTLYLRADRAGIGRNHDDPGDGFIYLVNLAPPVEQRFEWLEVTEVFTTIPASRIEGAMRAWNGIADKHPSDFEEFRNGVPCGRPSRMAQRKAADQVIVVRDDRACVAGQGLLQDHPGVHGSAVQGAVEQLLVPDQPVPRVEEQAAEHLAVADLQLQVPRGGPLARHHGSVGHFLRHHLQSQLHHAFSFRLAERLHAQAGEPVFALHWVSSGEDSREQAPASPGDVGPLREWAGFPPGLAYAGLATGTLLTPRRSAAATPTEVGDQAFPEKKPGEPRRSHPTRSTRLAVKAKEILAEQEFAPSAIADANNIPTVERRTKPALTLRVHEMRGFTFSQTFGACPHRISGASIQTRSRHAVVIVRPLGGAFPAPVHKPPDYE